jgi:hypothetical protein
MRSHGLSDRLHEILEQDLGQRLLDVGVTDEVEGDIDLSGLPNHGIDETIDRPLVEGIDQGDLSSIPVRTDLSGDRLELGSGAPGQEDPGPFASERPRYSGTDRPTAAVDHGDSVFQQHRSAVLSRWQG